MCFEKVHWKYFFFLIGLCCLSGSFALGGWQYQGFDSSELLYMIRASPDGNIYVALTSQASMTTKLYRSSDNCVSWKTIYEKNNNQSGPGIRDLLMVSSNVCMMITNDNSLIKSVDGGDSWTSASLARQSSVYSLIIEPDGTLLAGGNQVIYTSTDQGDTWTDHAILDNIYPRKIIADRAGRLFTFAAQDVYRSADMGKTWINVYHVTQVENHVVDIAGGVTDNIFIMRYDDFSGVTRLMRSVDHGDNWIVTTVQGIWKGSTISSLGDIYIVSSPNNLNSSASEINRFDDREGVWSKFTAAMPIPQNPDPNHAISGIYADMAGDLYLLTTHGFYKFDQKIPVEQSNFTSIPWDAWRTL